MSIISSSMARAYIHRDSRAAVSIVPPGIKQPAIVVRQTVSLRNLAATIADLAHLENGEPFPGASLANLWVDRPRKAEELAATETDGVLSELPVPNPADPNHGRSPAYAGPLIAFHRAI